MGASSEERWVDVAFYGGLGLVLLVSFLLGGWHGVAFVAMVGPLLPIAALIPWYFIAKHRGLVPRSAAPTTVTFGEGVVVIERERGAARVSWESVHHARLATNDNWSESKLLEDALTLLDPRDRELVRVPLSAHGFEGLERALSQRGVPIEQRLVSAPAFLD